MSQTDSRKPYQPPTLSADPEPARVIVVELVNLSATLDRLNLQMVNPPYLTADGILCVACKPREQ